MTPSDYLTRRDRRRMALRPLDTDVGVRAGTLLSRLALARAPEGRGRARTDLRQRYSAVRVGGRYSSGDLWRVGRLAPLAKECYYYCSAVHASLGMN